MSGSASFRVSDSKHLLNMLDRKIYEARAHSAASDADFVNTLRSALAQLHTSVLAFMQSAGYVVLFQRWQRGDHSFGELLPPPPDVTADVVTQLQDALHQVHDVSSSRSADESVKFTSAQRDFMTSFYTLQLRALEAAWRCVQWTVDETMHTLTSCANTIKDTQRQCKAWRRAWARQTRTVYDEQSTETPNDIVTSWMLMSIVTQNLDALVAEAAGLTATMSGCVKLLKEAPQMFARNVARHMEQVEQIKAAEIRRLHAHAVPPDLEVLSLNNFVAHVRDFLASTPELNLFL